MFTIIKDVVGIFLVIILGICMYVVLNGKDTTEEDFPIKEKELLKKQNKKQSKDN